ncbi:MAG: DNA repair exonuclease [Tissierellia bacterium]|nr:DNA repair exonuclease [Tissierellia bacterium]
MKKVKIMHIADYHIGYTYKFLKDLAEVRRLEVLKSLEDLSIFANDKGIDLVLIAGDFLEASSISPAYLGQIKEILAGFKARIFIVAGNHDYISLSSAYLDEDWPENTHIFKSNKIEKVFIEELNTSIFGASFTSSYQRRGFLNGNLDIDEKNINIGIFHGDALFSSDDLYNPISKDDITSSGLDYLALGHIHKKSGILRFGKTDFAYPGSAASLSFAENGPREAILIELDKEVRNYDFYQIGIGQFLTEDFDLTNYRSEREIAENLRKFLNEKYPSHEKNYYKIKLLGRIDEKFFIDLNLLKSFLSDLAYVQIHDASSLDLDLDLIKKENSLRGRVIHNIIVEKEEAKKQGQGDKLELLDRSLEICLKAFEGKI